jgi:DNA-binding MarR family transcriptional regulator
MATPPRSLGRMLSFATGATTRVSNDLLAEHDLPLAQWVILSALWRQDGQQISDLSAWSGHNPPATSRIVGRMEAKGLVKRKAADGDGRAVGVHLTEKGHSLNGLIDFYRQVNAKLLDGFSESEADTLFDMLARVTENARK